MKLSSVRVRNFRAIEELSLALDPGLTVLVGDNAMGKTSLLDAIALVLSPAVERCPAVSGRTPEVDDIRRAGNFRARYLYLQATSTTGLAWDRHKLRDATAGSREALRLSNRPVGRVKLHEQLDPIIQARQEGDSARPLPVVAYYSTDRAVILPPLRKRNFRDQHDPFEGLRGAFSPTTSFKAMFEWFLSVESEELREQRSDPAYVHPQLEGVRRAVRAAIPGCTRLEVATRPLRLEVGLTGANGAEERLSLQSLSGGYRTLLALVCDLARRMVQCNPEQGIESEAIVLIDEVDLHLHPRWQQTVLDDLRRAFPNAQLIVTTHSEQVIASALPHQVLRLDRDPERGVVASQPSSTFGATPDRIVEDVMGLARLRPQVVEEALNSYWALVRSGEGEGEPAVALRAKLDGWFRGADPEMVRIDAELRRQRFIRRAAGGA